MNHNDLYLKELEELNERLRRSLHPTKYEKIKDKLCLLLFIIGFIAIICISVYFLGMSNTALIISILSILIRFII